MVFGVILFFLGLCGLLGYGFFRMWEERRGARFMHARRAFWDASIISAAHTLVLGDVGRTLRGRLISILHSLSHRALVAIVALLHAIERPLARISHRMRMAPPKVPTQEPSAFLKTITPDKKTNHSASLGTQSEETPDTL